MIFVNNECLLENTVDLNQFIGLLDGEIYNDDSEKVINCMSDYLMDVWDRTEKVRVMMNKHISEDIIPVAIVDFRETANYKTVEVRVVSKNGEDIKPTEAAVVAFDEFCHKYFDSMKTLYDRFCELDLE